MTTTRAEAQSPMPVPAQAYPASIAHETQHQVEIFRLALMIDGDMERVRRWYGDDPIEELGRLTPRELCQAGFGSLLKAFLQQIQRGQRG